MFFFIIFILPNILISCYLSNLTKKTVTTQSTTQTSSKATDAPEEQEEEPELIGIIPDVSPTAKDTSLEEELHQKYRAFLAPADDELDYLYSSDHECYPSVKLCKARDSKAYGEVLGIEKKITIDDIEQVLSTNSHISEEYKQFIITYVTDWLTLYPESDFRVLYHNLKTLSIDVVSEQTMMLKTASTDSSACYVPKDNKIFLLEGQDFSRDSDNYIILTHELTHCARGASYDTEDGYQKRIKYYDYYLMGTYAEEGIITNIAYELQGLGKLAEFYPLQSNFYRIIMDCTGYNAEDFMNHSINYLMDMMDDYMGDDQYAYYIVALIDSISSQKYTSYQAVDFKNYQNLYDYLTKMYMKKYLLPDMTSEEAEQVFEDFCSNAMNRFDTMKRPYAISIDNFRPAFEQCMQELEIT